MTFQGAGRCERPDGKDADSVLRASRDAQGRGSTSWRGGRRRPRRPRPPRRVGPSVPDIASRLRDRRGFAAARPEFFARLSSGGNSRPGKPGVHYTQLDARVAPRYVRQTALLLALLLPHCAPHCRVFLLVSLSLSFSLPLSLAPSSSSVRPALVSSLPLPPSPSSVSLIESPLSFL